MIRKLEERNKKTVVTMAMVYKALSEGVAVEQRRIEPSGNIVDSWTTFIPNVHILPSVDDGYDYRIKMEPVIQYALVCKTGLYLFDTEQEAFDHQDGSAVLIRLVQDMSYEQPQG